MYMYYTVQNFKLRKVNMINPQLWRFATTFSTHFPGLITLQNIFCPDFFKLCSTLYVYNNLITTAVVLYLLVHEWEVVLEFTVACNQNAFPLCIVLGPSSTSQHLHHIQCTKLHPASLLRIVDLTLRTTLVKPDDWWLENDKNWTVFFGSLWITFLHCCSHKHKFVTVS